MQEQPQSAPGAPSAGEPIQVRVSSECPAASDFLAPGEAPTIYHDPRWGEVMRRAYGSRSYYLTAWHAAGLVGSLTLVARKSMLFGSHLCSVPYFDAAGILTSDDQARAALLAEAGKLRQELGAGYAELRQIESLGETIPVRADKVTMWLELPPDGEELWKGLKAAVRNQVRKPQKAGMTVAEGGGELLDEFHAVYVRNMRDLGSPPHSRRFFAEVLAAFGEHARLFVVRQGARAMAASFTLRDEGVHHVPWAGSDWRARRDCPNMLLYWSMLEAACRAGAKRFDFGRSTRDSGTFTFKKQWGAHEVPLYWHYLLPDGAKPPDLRPESPKYKLMVAAWKRLPLWLVRSLGPGIIGRLS
jgi:FemAB-related protein (PEP-CTERM system-associated)